MKFMELQNFERAAAALLELPDAAREWLSPIRDEEQLERALEAQEYLGQKIAGDLNHPLAPVYVGLIEKITAYEEVHYATEPTPPHVMLDFLMEQQGVRQHELAERLEVHQSNISRLINGRVAFTTDLIKQLSKIFNVSPAVFIG
ncbi:helix-turn-helix domain-containing protein [Deinococcus multiflagellatus]|uniref:Type II toxin-antitoxin system HigA family antitoxin n=1 Tax=Deinococcus multiflagellatus TaxID=1656887 RepID=A0ABW1ZQ38_9DEIO|nr:helix-turn-helix domain-containing protein [Deinococcus multiflagellatus]MBZ9715535.1 helix-turn-helix domain-containing protein [Deinococcus multiflagellatus]